MRCGTEVSGLLVERDQVAGVRLGMGGEIRASRVEVLNTSDTLPFPLADETNVAEEVRLRYRYLDLRRPRQQRILETRHRILLATRQFLDAQRGAVILIAQRFKGVSHVIQEGLLKLSEL